MSRPKKFNPKGANRGTPSQNVGIVTEHRRRQVEKLYIRNTPIRVIAHELGVSPTTVQADIRHMRKCWQENHAQLFTDVNAKELAKLDLLEESMWPQALDGKGYAVERILMIMDHRAKILGLYAPTQSRVEVITGDMLREEIRRMEQRERELREATVVDVEFTEADSGGTRTLTAPGSTP